MKVVKLADLYQITGHRFAVMDTVQRRRVVDLSSKLDTDVVDMEFCFEYENARQFLQQNDVNLYKSIELANTCVDCASCTYLQFFGSNDHDYCKITIPSSWGETDNEIERFKRFGFIE